MLSFLHSQALPDSLKRIVGGVEHRLGHRIRQRCRRWRWCLA